MICSGSRWESRVASSSSPVGPSLVDMGRSVAVGCIAVGSTHIDRGPGISPVMHRGKKRPDRRLGTPSVGKHQHPADEVGRRTPSAAGAGRGHVFGDRAVRSDELERCRHCWDPDQFLGCGVARQAAQTEGRLARRWIIGRAPQLLRSEVTHVDDE